MASGLFVNGNTLAASDLNTTTILNFASASARNAAISAPVESQYAYLLDTNQLTMYDGSAWLNVADMAAWRTWSPTVTGVTGGSGVVETYLYQQVGKTVRYKVCITLGTGGTISSASFTYPVAPANLIQREVTGYAQAWDSSATNQFAGIVTHLSGSTPLMSPRFPSSSTNNTLNPAGTSNTPFGVAWASGDILSFTGSYEAA